MKKKLNYIIALMIAAITLYSTNLSDSSQSSNDRPTQSSEQTVSTIESFNINTLSDTQYFNSHALEHIFYGTINRNGNATGFHFEETGEDAEIIESTRSKNDRNGVYRADVKIEGIKKNGFSSFFPQHWTPQEVVDAINIAYSNREYVSGNIYEGESQGLTIQMYLTDNDKIISAFPIYER